MQRDPETQTVSRPDFERLLDWEVERGRTERRAFTLAVVDLDGFGRHGEALGEERAGELLKKVAQTLRAHSREGDVIGRGEGDQFLVLLPDTPQEQGLFILEDVRRLLASSTFRLGEKSAKCTFSAGLASFPKDATSSDELVWKAEAALWRAKWSGRNRVMLAVSEKMVLKSNYYPRTQLDQLAVLANALRRTEASLLREALADLVRRHESEIKEKPLPPA